MASVFVASSRQKARASGAPGNRQASPMTATPSSFTLSSLRDVRSQSIDRRIVERQSRGKLASDPRREIRGELDHHQRIEAEVLKRAIEIERLFAQAQTGCAALDQEIPDLRAPCDLV